MKQRELFVVIGCDTDPSKEPQSLEIDDKTKIVVWDNAIRGVLNVKGVLERYEDDFGNHPKVTWFLRSDWQMNEIYNDWCWPANRYLSTWRKFEKDGDEIGWHPHLWRWSRDREWYQEVVDSEWIKMCLINGYDSLSRLFDIFSVRMGWDFHSNITMNAIDGLGIKVDLSALPGIRNARFENRHNIYDWSLSPEFPYHPSKNNYQCSGADFLNILELPVTCCRVPFWLWFVKSIVTRNLRRRYEAEIAKHPCFFVPNIKKSLQAISQHGPAFLVCYFHPNETLEKGMLFSLQNFQSNLDSIRKITKEYKTLVHYVTANQATRIAQVFNYSKLK